MLRIIGCTECNKEKALPFSLTWEHKSEWCKSCGHHNSVYKNYHFCSSKCLKKWANRFAGHKCKMVKSPMGGDYNMCKICLRGRWDVRKK